MKPAAKRVRIGEILLEQGLISAEQLARALAEQKNTGVLLGEILVQQNIVQPQVLLGTRKTGKELGVRDRAAAGIGLIDPPLLKLVGEEEATSAVRDPDVQGA